jgi:hypothetical protein
VLLGAGRRWWWDYKKTKGPPQQPKNPIRGGDTRVTSALSSFCDASTRDDIASFFREHPLPAAARTLSQTLERISNCIAMRESQTAKVSEFLQR